MIDNREAVKMIDKRALTLDIAESAAYVGGVIKAVTENLLDQGRYEEALDYLLGAEDAFASHNLSQKRRAVHAMREKIKEVVR